VYGPTLTSRYSRGILRRDSEEVLRGLLEPIGALVRADAALKENNPEAALQFSQPLVASTNRYFRNRGIRLTLRALQSLGRVQQCISTITSLYVADKHLHPLLSIGTIAKTVTKPLRREMRADLSLAIFLEMYSQYVGPDLASKLPIAYQEVLAAHDVARPSELKSVADRFEAPKLIYFLRSVCVPHVIDSSLGGSEQVEEERIALCQLLQELDPSRSEEYQAEIKDITTTQAIQRGLRQVEQSKIYVDLDGVQKAADKNLREGFNRYKTFADSNSERVLKEVLETLRKVRAGEDAAILSLRLPPGEASEILEALVKDLRDEFVSNTLYGLDGYLSQRIRHGTLQGHLRSPLEAVRLVTQQEAGTSRYRPNTSWGIRVSPHDPGIAQVVAQRLALFSEEFDKFVAIIRTEWIQIRRVDTEKGLFDFRISSALLRLVASSSPADASRFWKTTRGAAKSSGTRPSGSLSVCATSMLTWAATRS
jgi:hypothetical protein